jgi:hypothetical protein
VSWNPGNSAYLLSALHLLNLPRSHSGLWLLLVYPMNLF